MNEWHLQQAARTILNGGVVAYPTEGVMGLGCDPWNSEAVSRILQLKERAFDKGLIVIAASVDQLEPFIGYLDVATKKRVLSTWPGPVTWVVPAKSVVPPWVRGCHTGIAVRVTCHAIAAALCGKTGPLISTSANPSGRPAATNVLSVMRYFHGQIDYILTGSVGDATGPTEMRDALTNVKIR